MHREKTTKITSVYLHIVLTAFLVHLMSPGSALGDCTQKYPDSDVTRELNRADYLKCKLDVMVKNYADLLKDEQRLLSALRTAYLRKLEKEFEQKEQQVRLADYDAKVQSQRTIGTSLETSASAMSNDNSTGVTEEVKQERLKVLRQQLKESKDCSQALERKIKWAKGELKDDEYAEFCKLDFFFRLDKELNSKITSCTDLPD